MQWKSHVRFKWITIEKKHFYLSTPNEQMLFKIFTEQNGQNRRKKKSIFLSFISFFINAFARFTFAFLSGFFLPSSRCSYLWDMWICIVSKFDEQKQQQQQQRRKKVSLTRIEGTYNIFLFCFIHEKRISCVGKQWIF